MKTVELNSKLASSPLGQSCGHQGSFPVEYKYDGIWYYYEEAKTTPAVYKTQYRSRTVEKVPNYDWTDWSQWSDYNTVDPSSTQRVEQRTLYRTATRSQTTTYYYEQWSAWSDWGDTPVTAAADVAVETRTVYRYRKK